MVIFFLLISKLIALHTSKDHYFVSVGFNTFVIVFWKASFEFPPDGLLDFNHLLAIYQTFSVVLSVFEGKCNKWQASGEKMF